MKRSLRPARRIVGKFFREKKAAKQSSEARETARDVLGRCMGEWVNCLSPRLSLTRAEFHSVISSARAHGKKVSRDQTDDDVEGITHFIIYQVFCNRFQCFLLALLFKVFVRVAAQLSACKWSCWGFWRRKLKRSSMRTWALAYWKWVITDMMMMMMTTVNPQQLVVMSCFIVFTCVMRGFSTLIRESPRKILKK